MSKKLSVVFSSYNGERRLSRTLESFAAQDFPREEWELIAVDNNSTDKTAAILQSFSTRLPLISFKHQTPGKSGALNAAIERVQGEIVIFTDDDVRAESDWLSALARCADDNPDYGIFGGRILPEWEIQPSGDPMLDWIPMGSTFAIVDERISGPCESTKVWGPNTAIRRSAFDAGLRYREDIGPLPGGLFAMGEDQDIVMRADQAGYRSFRCAEAVVHHWIPASSVSEEWVQKRGERLGYGMPALFPSDVPSGPRIADVPLRTWIESAKWAVRAGLLYPLPNSKKRFWAIWKHRYMRGYRKGIRRYAPT